MLGSQIGPIEWMLVIRQVARQPLPRVIPEKTFMDGPIIYSYNTPVAGLVLQSTPVDWQCFLWIPEPEDSSIYNAILHPGHPTKKSQYV